jgi:hypothetical protein
VVGLVRVCSEAVISKALQRNRRRRAARHLGPLVLKFKVQTTVRRLRMIRRCARADRWPDTYSFTSRHRGIRGRLSDSRASGSMLVTPRGTWGQRLTATTVPTQIAIGERARSVLSFRCWRGVLRRNCGLRCGCTGCALGHVQGREAMPRRSNCARLGRQAPSVGISDRAIFEHADQ